MIITKHYGTACVLYKKNIDIKEGKRYLFWGRSGIGKTTALRIIAKLESNEEPCDIKLGKISMVFQEDRLLESFTARENLLAVCDDKAIVDSALSAFKIPINQRVREFSGGMKRRVAILRALIAPHDTILMDEPFTGLDEQTYKRVVNFISSKEKGKTLIIVNHDKKVVNDLLIDEIIEF